MKTIEIIGYKRANLGKTESKRIREEGDVPCVLYGGDKQIHFYTPAILFRDIVYTADAHFVEINVEGEIHRAVLQDVQFHPKMHHNSGGKFECGFINVDIQENDTVMFGSMTGSKLGIWMAHGEGRFDLSNESEYLIPVKYSYDEFPGNPNGSSFATAAMASENGRHVAIMPHLERSLFAWNWAHRDGTNDWEVSPWMEPFVNAKKWVKERI